MKLIRVLLLALATVAVGCSSDSVDDLIDDVEEQIGIVDGVSRKTIDVSRLGVNAFANDSRFGSASQQLKEVRDVLGIKHIRILFAWNDGVQSSPGAEPSFGFYDSIAAAIPSGVNAIVVITGLPSWMKDPSNWIDGNPRTTFVERWVRKVVNRYRSNGRIIGYQIWNEPNMTANPDNGALAVVNSPANYVEMLARAFSVIQDLASDKIVMNASTTAINQNYPDTLNYNRGMKDAGVLSFVNVFAFHYYGRQYEKFLLEDGARDFLNSLNVLLWATETGIQGVNNQLVYAEQTWPFLREKLPKLDRIYQYQFADSSAADSTFGLKTLDSDFPVSDLYIHLRDRSSAG